MVASPLNIWDRFLSNIAMVRLLSCSVSDRAPDLPSTLTEILIMSRTLRVVNTTAPTKGTKMAIGTVKWFNDQKGFGFIQPDDGGTDVFVHISAVERSNLGSIREGQKIRYELERDDRNGKMSAAQLQAA